MHIPVIQYLSFFLCTYHMHYHSHLIFSKSYIFTYYYAQTICTVSHHHICYIYFYPHTICIIILHFAFSHILFFICSSYTQYSSDAHTKCNLIKHTNSHHIFHNIWMHVPYALKNIPSSHLHKGEGVGFQDDVFFYISTLSICLFHFKLLLSIQNKCKTASSSQFSVNFCFLCLVRLF